MDSVRAHRLAAELIGHQVGGFEVVKLIHWGKSAVVFQACRTDQHVALKVFDRELVERYGADAQLTRIKRELTLVGHSFDHLVQIIEGGQCEQTGYLYLAMELLQSPWIVLSHIYKNIPSERIGPIVSQIAAAAQWLEQKNLVHRDIKPQNIMVIDDFTQAKLSDLGIIREIALEGITDDTGRPFIGTLRYSSPEFLLRQEIDDTNGWRAVSFYQIGAVLHDLIMRKPLFSEFSEPYAKLAHAVQVEKVVVKRADVDPALITLCQSCLVKNPSTRLRLLTWDNFANVANPAGDSAEIIKERVRNRSLMGSERQLEPERPERIRHKNQAAFDALFEALVSKVRIVCVSDDALPTVTIRRSRQSGDATRRFSATFPSSPRHGIPDGLVLLFEIAMHDFSDQVCAIKCGYFLAEQPSTSDDRLELLFEGVFSTETIGNLLVDFLYRTFDRVQSDAG